jgi:hypothetical protein
MDREEAPMLDPELVIAVLMGTATDSDRATLHIAALQALVAREQCESAYWRARAAHEHDAQARAVGDYERSLAIIANLSADLATARTLHQQQSDNCRQLSALAMDAAARVAHTRRRVRALLRQCARLRVQRDAAATPQHTERPT